MPGALLRFLVLSWTSIMSSARRSNSLRSVSGSPSYSSRHVDIFGLPPAVWSRREGHGTATDHSGRAHLKARDDLTRAAAGATLGRSGCLTPIGRLKGEPPDDRPIGSDFGRCTKVDAICSLPN